MSTVWGILLPESTLREEFIAVLAAFVAINTIVYVTLAVAKVASGSAALASNTSESVSAV